MPREQINSIIHHYNIGQFDILIALNVESAYPKKLPPIDIQQLINFDLPENFGVYKETAGQIVHESGSVLNICTAEDD